MNDHHAQHGGATSAEHRAGKLPGAGPFPGLKMVLLLLLALILVFLWQWQDTHRELGRMQQQLARQGAEMEGSSKAYQVLLAQDQQQVRELSAKLAALEAEFADSRNQRAALETLYGDLTASRQQAALAETEQLLLAAQQQMQLFRDARAALAAMQNAEQGLRRQNNAALGSLRKAIGADIEKLRALPSPDLAALSLQLTQLIQAADTLPLAQQRRVADETPEQAGTQAGGTFWQKLLREIGQELRQLVRIENTGRADVPLLPPDQQFYLRENLKLHLLSARISLLSNDQSGFDLEMKTARSWIERYFDAASKPGMLALDQLKQLGATRLDVAMPDIAATLRMVREYRRASESRPAKPAATRPAPHGNGPGPARVK